jgi:5-methylcytosine-specific restriction endonuclease McrA
MSLDKTKVLVLNASYEPLSICDARNAVLLLFCGKAMIVASHPEHRIRTVTESYPLPIIVRLTVYVRVEFRNAVLSRKNLFRRDEFRCQYCGRKDVPLTIDHVIPRSRGGGESWENLITACKSCNSLKGNRTPAEAGMTMLQKPVMPSHITLMRRHYLSISDEWKPYLYMC